MREKLSFGDALIISRNENWIKAIQKNIDSNIAEINKHLKDIDELREQNRKLKGRTSIYE